QEQIEAYESAKQSALSGGRTSLIKAGFKTSTEAGNQPEVTYCECLHEVKLIIDLIYEGGLENMRYSLSDTAQWGDFVSGPRVINDETKERMQDILKEIQDGSFAKDWVLENQAGRPRYNAINNQEYNHPITQVGKDLRALMPFVGEAVNK